MQNVKKPNKSESLGWDKNCYLPVHQSINCFNLLKICGFPQYFLRFSAMKKPYLYACTGRMQSILLAQPFDADPC